LGMPQESSMVGTITGIGLNFQYAEGLLNGFGGIINLTLLKLIVPIKDPITNLTKKFPAVSGGYGFTFVLDIIKGEKKDIAGEIIQKKPTLAVFAGININLTSFNMDFSEQSWGDDFSMETRETGFPMGFAADIPLGYYISLVPYGRFIRSKTKSSTTVLYYDPWINPITGEILIDQWFPYEVDSTYSTKRIDYGMDIDLRPFRNAPEWKISLGTVMSQVEGMSKGNLMITFGIKWERGKHYSSTTFGPKLH
jgi:hypothetical protein